MKCNSASPTYKAEKVQGKMLHLIVSYVDACRPEENWDHFQKNRILTSASHKWNSNTRLVYFIFKNKINSDSLTKYSFLNSYSVKNVISNSNMCVFLVLKCIIIIIIAIFTMFCMECSKLLSFWNWIVAERIKGVCFSHSCTRKPPKFSYRFKIGTLFIKLEFSLTSLIINLMYIFIHVLARIFW